MPVRRAVRGALARAAPWRFALGLLLCAGVSPTLAEPSATPAQSLDEQVQEIKSDVLDIAAELARLEEKLLFPSGTQVALFVSLAEAERLRLDSVRIRIDGEPVAHHIYTFKEIEALRKGGVQRIYTGNLPTGEHRLEVSVAGKIPGGSDYESSRSFSFQKEAEPKLIEITLSGKGSSDDIQLAER